MVTPIGARNHKSETMSHRAEGEGQDRETTQEANIALASTEIDPEIDTLIPDVTGLTVEKDLGRDQGIDMIAIEIRETETTGSTRVDLRDRVDGGE